LLEDSNEILYTEEYNCEYCHKNFSNKNNMSRHQKRCRKNKDQERKKMEEENQKLKEITEELKEENQKSLNWRFLALEQAHR